MPYISSPYMAKLFEVVLKPEYYVELVLEAHADAELQREENLKEGKIECQTK